MMGLWEMLLKLVAAIVLGGLIGLERETHGRPAGLRTHILVCFGAALFTLCSYSIAGKTFDPARITAQIVTGIGFLGAGTIIHYGSIVRGLTTAASIWTVAAIGIAVAIGGDMLILAAVSSALVFATLNVVAKVERAILLKQEDRLLTAVIKPGHDAMCDLLATVARHGLQLRVLGVEDSADQTAHVVRLQMRSSGGFDSTAIDADLAALDNVISYTWE